jgi:glucose-6-phosphate 1-dehydrogenase
LCVLPPKTIEIHLTLSQVEKPFGKDLGSSRELQQALGPDWTEDEIFRIDHYLGKEMVKNILILRFGNEFFGATWNRNHIDNVQVGQRVTRRSSYS